MPGPAISLSIEKISVLIDSCLFDTLSSSYLDQYCSATTLINGIQLNLSLSKICQNNCLTTKGNFLVIQTIETTSAIVEDISSAKNYLQQASFYIHIPHKCSLIMKHSNISGDTSDRTSALITESQLIASGCTFYNESSQSTDGSGSLMNSHSFFITYTNIIQNSVAAQYQITYGNFLFAGTINNSVILKNNYDYIFNSIGTLTMSNIIINKMDLVFSQLVTANITTTSGFTQLPFEYLSINECRQFIKTPLNYAIYIIISVSISCAIILFVLVIYFVIKRAKVQREEISLLADRALLNEFG